MDTDIRRPYVATIITLSSLSPSNFAAAPLPGDERIVGVMDVPRRLFGAVPISRAKLHVDSSLPRLKI
jgi:hypothetical protein